MPESGTVFSFVIINNLFCRACVPKGTNTRSIERLLVNSRDHLDDDAPPTLLRGRLEWPKIRTAILKALGSRDVGRSVNDLLLIPPLPLPDFHPVPVGAPRRGHTWHFSTGRWVRYGPGAEEKAPAVPKRRPGAPPKGKQWDV
jgi:hypothetical protein